MASWYYAVGSQTQGPVSEDELRSMAQRGELSATSYVVMEGETVWQALADVAAGLRLAPNPAGGFSDTASIPPVAAAGQTMWGGPPPGGDQPGVGWGAAPNIPGPNIPGPNIPGPGGGWGGAPVTDGRGGPWDGGAQPWAQPGQPGIGAGQAGWAQPGSNPYAAPAGQYTPWSAAAPTGAYGVGPGALHPDLLAGWGVRLAAKLIDSILIIIPTLVLYVALALNDIRDINTGNNGFQYTYTGATVAAQLLAAVAGYVYLSVLNGQGQTLGKKALKIRVVDRQSGQPIGVGRGFLRHLTQLSTNVPLLGVCIGLPYLLIDSLWPLWDANNQTIHDKLAGSVVIKAG